MSKRLGHVGLKWPKEELTEAIIQYLQEHPQASDTLEGIAEWWIMRQQVQVDVDALNTVLRELTKAGFLEEIGEGDNRRYALNTSQSQRPS